MTRISENQHDGQISSGLMTQIALTGLRKIAGSRKRRCGLLKSQTCHRLRRHCCFLANNMTLRIEPRHDLSPNEVDAIEDRLYDHNSHATGRRDGQGLGFVIRDEAGQVIGVAAGYTWAGTAELKQMWIDEAYRGRGYSRALLNAFVAEACSRGVRRIWVASYDFQAPRMYEKAGFRRMAEFEGWPEGHTNVVLCKTLSGREN